MEGLLYHVIIMISLVPHLSFCQDEDVFHCSAKPGCQISQCDPIAPTWNQPRFRVSHKVDRNEFPITCKSKNTKSNNNGFLLNFMQGMQGNTQDIRNIRSEMKELEEQVEQNTELTQDVRDIRSEIKELEEQVEQNTELTQDLKSMKSEIKELGELKEQNLNFEYELSTLRGCDRATKQELEKLKKRNQNLENELSTIRRSDRSINQELQELKNELSLLKRTGKMNDKGCFSTCKASRLADGSNEVANLCLPVIGSTDVRCDFETDGGDWLIILRRSDGSISFDRNWSDYVNGFGILGSEFWFGLEKLHILTSTQKYELRIDMENFNKEKRFAKYSKFIVGPYSEKYKLTIRGYSGDAKDSFTQHDQRSFSTKNNDNDTHDDYNCAEGWKGGWWFDDCIYCFLTGPYVKDEVVAKDTTGIKWNAWKKSDDQFYSLQFVEMKIRPVE